MLKLWMVVALLVCGRSSMDPESIPPDAATHDDGVTDVAVCPDARVKASGFDADGFQPELGFLPIRL